MAGNLKKRIIYSIHYADNSRPATLDPRTPAHRNRETYDPKQDAVSVRDFLCAHLPVSTYQEVVALLEINDRTTPRTKR